MPNKRGLWNKHWDGRTTSQKIINIGSEIIANIETFFSILHRYRYITYLYDFCQLFDFFFITNLFALGQNIGRNECGRILQNDKHSPFIILQTRVYIGAVLCTFSR